MSLLAMASCAVDKRILINPGAKPETWTNMYVLLYGPSGARKGEALMDALRLLAEGIPDAPMFPMNFTMEALRGRMAQDSEDAGRTAGLILAEELSNLLGGRDYLLSNSLFMSKVWDGRREETFLTIAHQEQIIRNPYVTMGACSTPAAFGDLDPKALSAGFLRRLLIVQEHGPKGESALPGVTTALFNTILVPRFADRFAPKRIDPKGVLMRLSPDAVRLNEEWYTGERRKLRQDHVAPRESNFVDTLQVHVFKVAALLHLLDGHDPEILSERSLEQGIAVMRLLLPGTFAAYGTLVSTHFAKICMAIRRIAAEGPLDVVILDAAVKAETGATPDQVAGAKFSLMQDRILIQRRDGKVEIR